MPSHKTQIASLEGYRLSFGTGGLYVLESAQLSQSYSDLKCWDKVIEHAVENNRLQFKSSGSTRRAVREICTRLKALSPKELNFFITGDPFDQSLISWLACCRTYKFIGDFATQVLLENFVSYKLELGHVDFDFFYDDLSWPPKTVPLFVD